MSGGRGYPLPGLLGFTLDVALLADGSWYLGVGRDLVRPRHDPVVQLPGLGGEFKGVAGVAGEGVMLPLQLVDQQVGSRIGPDEDLPAGHEDVAATTEIVVVHNVIIGLHSAGNDQEQYRSDRPPERQLDSPVPSDQPGPDRAPPPPECHGDRQPNDGRQDNPSDHDPAGTLEDPLDDGDERIGKRRPHQHRVYEATRERIPDPDDGVLGRLAGLNERGPCPQRFYQLDRGHMAERKLARRNGPRNQGPRERALGDGA